MNGNLSRRRAPAALALAAITLLAAATLAGPALAQTAAQPTSDANLAVVSVDTSSAPTVRLVVAAPPQLARDVLPASAFAVEEDGGARPALTVEPLAAEQMEVALVIDTSGSMVGAPLAAAKAAAQSLLNQLPPSVPVAVVGFGAAPVVASPRSSDRAAQLAAIDRLAAGGQTALYDAVATGVAQLSSESSVRRAVVLLSDGGDTNSTTTLDGLTAALASAKVPVFAVELKTAESNSAALSRLAGAGGGQAVSASAPAALAGVFDGIAKQLVRQYALTWRTAARGATGVQVVLQSAGVRAVARAELSLPAAAAAQPAGGDSPAASPATPAPGTEPYPEWALGAGAALLGVSFLFLLVPVFYGRAPRSRALRRAEGNIAHRSLTRAGDNASRVFEAVVRRFEVATALNTRLERAGLDIRPGELLLVVALAVLVLGWGGAVLVGPVAGVVGAVLAVLLARVVLDIMARRRQDRFGNQLGDTLQMLAGALRAGYGLGQAVDVVAREAESPTSDEFRRLTMEVRLGRDFSEAMRALGERVRSTDFDWVLQSFDIHREVGGDLAEVLDNVGSTIRDRNRVRRQVRALSAEGRLSAVILGLMPLVLGLVVSIFNPGYLAELTGTGPGRILMAGAATLMTIGGLWLRQIVKPTF